MPGLGPLLSLAIHGVDVDAWNAPQNVALFLQLLCVVIEVLDEVAEHIVFIACMQLFSSLQREIFVKVDVFGRYFHYFIVNPVTQRLFGLVLFINGVIY